MVLGALRSIIRPLSRTLLSAGTKSAFSLAIFSSPTSPTPILGSQLIIGSLRGNSPFIPASNAFLHSLTDTRFPKRKPVDKPRRKRAYLRPQGPYAWIKYVPDQPILSNQSNGGSVKRRNEKKRMKQKHTFIMAEKRKRKAQMQEAKRKKIVKRVERKMAAVARDRAWAQRLVELQQLEEKKAATA